ncbi:PREDICTED: uncharacterized protein LOC103324955 [Prunus mume]|uniref:Uncharacterized protein LOC103324955 n=1 Tax=Prunus mume TaxID=102107 RepID=A0ABM0NIH5_PRUMU|nr:PREDICTED: uncharacterized protein LOC103324955 [Prunus mume]
MEERKLNLNARFLSVRRIATTTVCTDGEKEKIIQRPDGRHTLPPYKSDFCLEQVTEPVAVPFHWEHIPGKAKEDKEPETQPREKTSVTPRLPPGKPIDYVTKQTLEKDHADRNGIRPQFKSYSLNENVMDLKCSKEKTNERRALEVEDEDDVYSDALETISPTESFSFNCSASGLSQSDGADVKQSRAFSVDLQTRDLMMSRFLPAAKAMALETPHYAAKKQYIAPEQPRQVTRVIREDIRPLSNEQGSHMELQYDQYKEEEESEGEDDEYDPSGSISAKGCGLFPRLCLRNSLCLLSPVPGMKGRTRALMSSSSGVIRPEKTTCGRSHSQPLNKHALDAAYKHKSKGGVKSGELHKFENKKAGESSRFSHSGDLKKGRSSPLRHSRSACISPYRNEAPSGVKSGELQKFEYKQAGESSLFTRSGDLKKGRLSPLRHSRSDCISPYRNEAPSGVKSAELQKFEYKQAGESRRFSHSGDLKNGRSSTFSKSRSACISPYRHEAPSGVKSGELQKFEYKQAGESSRFSYSGDLKKGRSSTFSNSRSACISPYRNEAPCGVKSGELQKSEYKQAGASSCLSHSGDFKNGRSSPFRHSRSACISPYRNEAPKSPFPGVGFLGIPREESVKANSKFNLHNKGGHKFQEVLSHQRSIQGPRSESPTIEKTLYVDTVNTAKLSCSNSSSLVTKEQVDSTGEDFDTLLKSRDTEETYTESSFLDIKCLTYLEGGGTLEHEVSDSIDDNLPSLSDLSHVKGQVVAVKNSQLGTGQDIEPFNCSNSSANGKSGQIIKADPGIVDASSVQSPLPPPLPRSPSQSWLWSTLSSISSRYPISQARTKRLDSKTSSTSTKWETIVKTSNLRHDHVRYSEELIAHISQQSKS